jgi:hypothetical protein
LTHHKARHRRVAFSNSIFEFYFVNLSNFYEL